MNLRTTLESRIVFVAVVIVVAVVSIVADVVVVAVVVLLVAGDEGNKGHRRSEKLLEMQSFFSQSKHHSSWECH